MRRLICAGGLIAICFLVPLRSAAQADELAQLALNIEKLAQLKKILTGMYDGYKILHGGYNRIKDIADGNYKLHQVFLDGLYAVNPAIKKYSRIGDIVAYQGRMLGEYRYFFRLFREAELFSVKHLEYLEAVYDNLLAESAGNLEELLIVITANQARMSDDERLAAIDRIFYQMEDKLLFLRDFNQSTQIYAMQKMKERTIIDGLETMYDAK